MIVVGDIVERIGAPGPRCRVTWIYPDGDWASFEVVRKDGERDRRHHATGGFTGSLRWYQKVEG